MAYTGPLFFRRSKLGLVQIKLGVEMGLVQIIETPTTDDLYMLQILKFVDQRSYLKFDPNPRSFHEFLGPDVQAF